MEVNAGFCKGREKVMQAAMRNKEDAYHTFRFLDNRNLREEKVPLERASVESVFLGEPG